MGVPNMSVNLTTILLIVTTAIGWLLFVPVPGQDPIADYDVPHFDPIKVDAQLHDKLEILVDNIRGLEDIEILDEENALFSADHHGNIWKFNLSNFTQREIIATTSGRPLGLKLDNSKKNLIIVDAYAGLLSLNLQTRDVHILAVGAEGERFMFLDHLDIASDGTIYFSDGSSKYRLNELSPHFLSGSATGRLLKYDPKTKQTKVLVRGLYFANGVALSDDEDFVVVAELWKARIKRHWLKGPKAGTTEDFATNLPGLVDNIDNNKNGTFWCAASAVSSDFMGFKIAPYVPIKRALMRLDLAGAKSVAIVFGVDSKTGKVTKVLADLEGKYIRGATTAFEHKGYIYIGTYSDLFLARYKL